jgi:hypothetical protein
MREGKTQKEALGQCYGMFREHHKKNAAGPAMSTVDQAHGGSFIGLARPRLRRKQVTGHKLATDHYALKAYTDAPAVVNEDKFSITIPFAASKGRDRIGDVLEVEGIETGNHARNPVAFLDHGINEAKPIGKCESPDGTYTVHIMADKGLAVAEIFLAKSDIFLLPRQIFELYEQKMIRAGSIGYRIIEAEPIPPEPERGYFKKALHLVRTELLEVSAVGLPMNQDAVKCAFGRKWAGEELAPEIKSLLLPYYERQRVYSFGLPLGANDTAKGSTMKNKSKTIKTKAIDETVTAPPAETPAETPTEQQPENVPHGAVVLAELYARLEFVKEVLVNHNLDNDKTIKFVDGLAPKLDELCASVGTAFEEIYPELEPLAKEEAGSDGGSDAGGTDSKADEEGDEGEGDEGGEPKAGNIVVKAKALRRKQTGDVTTGLTNFGLIQTKRHLGKSQLCSIKEAAEYMQECSMDEALPKMMKRGHAIYAKSLMDVAEHHEQKDAGADAEGGDEISMEAKALILKMHKQQGEQLDKLEKHLTKALGRA